MKLIIEWLSNYGAEYDASKKILYIRKPMHVGDFVELKKVIKENCNVNLNDFIIESEIKVWKIK